MTKYSDSDSVPYNPYSVHPYKHRPASRNMFRHDSSLRSALPMQDQILYCFEISVKTIRLTNSNTEKKMVRGRTVKLLYETVDMIIWVYISIFT